MLNRTLVATFLFASLLSVDTHAAVFHTIDSNGYLIGAKGVDVDGSLFDVEFAFGTFNDVFGGASAFNEMTLAEAEKFSSALQDQVFVDIGARSFDRNLSTTIGCQRVTNCRFLTPYDVGYSYYEFVAVSFFNNSADETSDVLGTRLASTTSPVGGGSGYVWADWKVAAPAPVPLPAAAWLFGSGLVGLAGLVRSRRKASAN